jgi:hypothetical protein
MDLIKEWNIIVCQTLFAFVLSLLPFGHVRLELTPPVLRIRRGATPAEIRATCRSVHWDSENVDMELALIEMYVAYDDVFVFRATGDVRPSSEAAHHVHWKLMDSSTHRPSLTPPASYPN